VLQTCFEADFGRLFLSSGVIAAARAKFELIHAVNDNTTTRRDVKRRKTRTKLISFIYLSSLLENR